MASIAASGTMWSGLVMFVTGAVTRPTAPIHYTSSSVHVG